MGIDKTVTIPLEEYEEMKARIAELESKLNAKSNERQTYRNGFSEAFKKHLKIFFDACPEIGYVVVSEAYKCYDSPYEAHVDSWLSESNAEQIDALEQVIGEHEAQDWLDTFLDFVEKEVECYQMHDANDLYPGQTIKKIITDDFDYDEIEEN